MESSNEQMSRLDRDSHYRTVALECAVQRAKLRTDVKEDSEEVLSWADTFYNYLKGDGERPDPPKEEKQLK